MTKAQMIPIWMFPGMLDIPKIQNTNNKKGDDNKKDQNEFKVILQEAIKRHNSKLRIR